MQGNLSLSLDVQNQAGYVVSVLMTPVHIPDVNDVLIEVMVEILNP
jgi:hypothetical protein